MKKIIFTLLLTIPILGYAQMNVCTVAGSMTATALGDGGSAVDALIGPTEGIWLDGNCNLYISAMGQARIRRVNLDNGIITTIAGNGTGGFSGDNGPATNAQIQSPYGLYADSTGVFFFVDQYNRRVRKVATSGIITTFAGGGSTLGDGGPATDAQFVFPQNVYGDKMGNIYIAGDSRIGKVDASTGIITTIAGTGSIAGLSGDGGSAISAQISNSPAGMSFDKFGNLCFADRGNSRIRKINFSTGLISTIAGTTNGYSGDGGLATDAKLNAPISLAIDIYGNIVLGDNQNNRMRIVDAATGIIKTIGGTGVGGLPIEGSLALSTDMHPEFIYLDRGGNLYYSNYGRQVRKITCLNPGLAASGSVCNPNNVPPENVINNKVEIYPNPVTTELTINLNGHTYTSLAVTNSMGQIMLNKNIASAQEKLNLAWLPPGVYFLILKGEAGLVQLHFVKT